MNAMAGHGPVVLGLCAFTHDSAAALIAGGQLTGMVEEERLSGVKHTREYPQRSVGWLLEEAGLLTWTSSRTTSTAAAT